MYSVVMPTARASQTIDAAIKSVMMQSLPPAEVLVILNNSDDDTFSKLEVLKKNFDKIKLIEFDTNNISDAMNFGIQHAQTSIIMRMDADDIMHRDRAALQLPVLSKGVDLVGGSIRWFGSKNSRWKVHTKDAYLKTLALFSSPLPSPTITFKNHGKLRYISGYSYCEDMAFQLSAIRSGFELAGISKNIIRYRAHANSMTSNWQQENSKAKKIHKIRDSLLNEHWDHLLGVGARGDLLEGITMNNVGDIISKINIYEVHPSYLLRRLISDGFINVSLSRSFANRVYSYFLNK